ncbi:MAG: MFS transporter [Granulosicoccus sp.]
MLQHSPGKAVFFYQFLGAHSLLIGLLPFFLPVYLWTRGLDLAAICLLTGVSGLAFCLSLGLWQKAASRWQVKTLVILTFALELGLIAVVGLFTALPGAALQAAGSQTHNSVVLAALCIGLANGAYNAFFWTTQRCLFLDLLGRNDTGRQYGNLQIIVSIFLKTGILAGGFLLDNGGFVWLLLLSAAVSLAAGIWLTYSSDSDVTVSVPALPVTLRQSLVFSDNRGSRTVFLIDGIFLYLESHFWTLSLFLVVRQDFSSLGVAVVLLALLFAVLFFILKNRVDSLPVAPVFKAAVLVYSLSWLLRMTLDHTAGGTYLLTALIIITFCSSFFRLSFNKLFFDYARQTQSTSYLLVKSYASQCTLGVVFLVTGAVLLATPVLTATALASSYAVAALFALLYLSYATGLTRV